MATMGRLRPRSWTGDCWQRVIAAPGVVGVRVALVVLVSLVNTMAWSQTVNGVAGELTHGGNVVVAGSNFGTTTLNGLIFDDVETGSFKSAWTSKGDLTVGTESRHPHSSYCGTLNMQGSLGEAGNKAYFSGGSNQPKWFVQFWFMLDSNFDFGNDDYLPPESRPADYDANLANLKLFRMWTTGSSPENVYIGGPSNLNNYLSLVTEAIGPNGFETIAPGSLSANTREVWHLYQMEYADSGQNVANGIIKLWFDGKLIYSDTAVLTREDSADYKRPNFLGFYDAHNDSGTDRDDFYIDDAYINNSFARVEIGNNPVYNSCTHREVQVPSSWTTSSIAIKVNQGSFPAGDNAYLFVVNDSGSVSNALPVQFGTSGDPGAPGRPGTPVMDGQ